VCGIAGFIDSAASTPNPVLEATATDMASTLAHRGPDDAGVWADAASGVALGHRRLSIIDLSPTGHQPMVSADGRYALVYNGEIYNFRRLRSELEALGVRFRGTSDTEVLLESIARWGLPHALPRLNGMFALAVWDRTTRVLQLARDRFGEKPLYYGWIGSTFLFGSELKALRAHPAFSAEVDRDALAGFLRRNYVPAPRSIYQRVSKLEPGSFATVDPERHGSDPVVQSYWSAVALAREAMSDRDSIDEQEALEQLEDVLADSIRLRMVADVPIGAFLSGGIDSSLVVALMQAQHSQPIRTFTIASPEATYNEAPYAEAVARHLGTDHTQVTVTPQEALDTVPRLSSVFDEPFADSSQIPTLAVAGLTRRYVKVSLSGDGGDELFGGYQRYLRLRRLLRGLAVIPEPVRSAAARTLRAVPSERWHRLSMSTGRFLPRRVAIHDVARRLQKFGPVLDADPTTIYRTLVSYCEPGDVVLGANENNEANGSVFETAFRSSVERAMCFDTGTYLPDDILTKVDRSTMAVSLEARVPLLDHRVYELAWRLPLSLRLRGSTGKWILRQLLHRYVPPDLVERPKMGFAIPIGEWLRGPLRPWAEELLSAHRLASEQFLNPAPIRRWWSEHLERRANWEHQLWAVLMFEAWLEEVAA
jgi:asparagine synthase (glutamine-hydrolysing)